MGSVNNFALHLSLETPADGYIGGRTHSGYTSEQYDALAVVLDEWMSQFGIPPEAITTHEHVDLGGEHGIEVLTGANFRCDSQHSNVSVNP